MNQIFYHRQKLKHLCRRQLEKIFKTLLWHDGILAQLEVIFQ